MRWLRYFRAMRALRIRKEAESITAGDAWRSEERRGRSAMAPLQIVAQKRYNSTTVEAKGYTPTKMEKKVQHSNSTVHFFQFLDLYLFFV